MRRRTWLLSGGAVAVAALLSAGAVWAQSDEGSAGSFLDRVAEKLGIQGDDLQEAIRDARADQIDEAAADGKITDEQADELKERLDSLPEDAPFLPGRFGGPGFGFRMGFGPGTGFEFGLLCPGLGPLELREGLSEFLGIDARTLDDELRAEGATLAGVAAAHGKSRDELTAFLEGKLKNALDEAVADGAITQERADDVLQRGSEMIDELADRPLPLFHHKRLMPGMPAPDGAPGQRFEREEILRS